MSNYKTVEKRFEYVRKSLPLFLRANDYLIQIREATVEELEEFCEKGSFDRDLMTCRPIIERKKEDYIRLFTDLVENKNNMLCGIFCNDGSVTQMIGRISFYDYNSRNLSIEVGYLLAEKWQKKGIMRMCLNQILITMFEFSDLNKIYAQTCEINFSSRKLLEYCGFSVDAKLRDHHLYKNHFYDDYIYSILRVDRIKLEEKCTNR